MENLSLLDKFADPELIQALSTSEKLMGCLMIMVLGMGVTFIALMIIWGLILVMTKLIGGAQKKAAVVAQAPTPAPVAQPVVEESNDEELVAVISAAVAATLQTSVNNLVVRNITRVSDATPAWGRAGRAEQMNSRF